MPREEVLSALYAAAAGRTTWEAALGILAASLDLWLVQILSVDVRNGQLLLSVSGGDGSTPEAALDYVRHYNTIDPRKQLALATPPGEWIDSARHHDHAFQARHPFYRDFLIPHGGGHLLGARLFTAGHSEFMLAFVSRHQARPLGEVEMDAVRQLRHHIEEALRNYVHLRDTLAELEMGRELLAPFHYPMFLVNEARGIWHLNAAGARLLEAGDLLTGQNSILSARHRRNEEALLEGMAELRGQAGERRRAVVRLARPDAPPCLVFLSPMRPEDSMGVFGMAPRILVIVHDPAGRGRLPDPFILAECFDLTPAEARVAVQLAGGAAAKEIAQRMQLSVATVRTHVSRLLEKFGVSRQADLVRMVMELPARGH